MKIRLSPSYMNCRNEVEQIVAHFERQGGMIYHGRNMIKTFQTANGTWNVKRYHCPSLFNRIVYTFLRKPKGLRAFEYPNRIIPAGFETPYPIAYVEQRQWGLISSSFFISEHCPYKRRFYEFGDAKVADVADILTEFVRFTAGLHEAGIYHRDYSPGNILFDQKDGEWHFSIVDINRMVFGPVSIKKGCLNFARLWGQPEMFRFIATEYAHARHANEKDCTRWVMKARNRFWKPRAKRLDLPYNINF
ncbi:MAG: tyrosine protein kinase [Bacteroidaceae bacterium]|nr:tyrosine protein kinase [Bacteroidaceae bacterium]